MLDILLYVIAFIITVPIIPTVILYYGLKYAYQNPIRAFHQSINWTTILYIINVSTMLAYLFGSSYIGIIMIVLICMLMVIIVIQWKKHTEIEFHRALKLLWRIAFLLFFVLYIVLLGYGIMKKIIFQ